MSATAQRTYDMYVGAKSTPARSGATFPTTDPATAEVWAQIAQADAADVDHAVRVAHAAFTDGPWATMSPTARGRLITRFGELIYENAERIAETETRENGKLYREMVAQLRAAPDWLVYFGGLADKIQSEVIPLPKSSAFGYTLFEPLGVIGVVSAWNSPVLLAAMASGPALAAGNTVVIKPSEVATAGVLEAMALAEEAGLPPGVVNVVTGDGVAGAALVEHPLVRKVSFTGGTNTGRRVASAVGERLASCTLELGGKSPNIVFDDADLDAAEAGLLAGIFGAAGQTCLAGSRALLHRSIYDELVERLSRRAGAIKLGHPMDPDTQMGPIATEAQTARIERMVDQARQTGARITVGGSRPQVEGLPNAAFFSPTIMVGAEQTSEIVQEEVFGPVLVIEPFETEAQALSLANGTDYGLASGVWTADVKRALRMASALQAGTVWINTYRAIAFNMPFGGYKSSGLGHRNGVHAVQEFLQTKSVWVDLSDDIVDPFVLRMGDK